MTTRTIPEYLEDERQKHSDDRQRVGKEAKRIHTLPSGRHRTAKQPDRELASPGKARKTTAPVRKDLREPPARAV